MNGVNSILEAKTALGIEFGSTRVKAVLIDLNGKVLASGAYDWENSLIDGIWTYSLEEIHKGLQACYASMKADAARTYGVKLTKIGALGISAMMHGYMAFDREGNLLTPFRTWRNRNTQEAADALTELFDFNIPLRWTISHLYQCILNQETHVSRLSYITTLGGYIHRLLTGEPVTGIGDASGIFPVDSHTGDYDAAMMQKFNALIEPCGFTWKTKDLFPRVMKAGSYAGTLTEKGAAFLDAAGDLEAGIPLCPPEGDAGTGMTATNAIRPLSGNVSVGTSTFAMVVLEKHLSKMYREIDMVTTPNGYPVAMAHASNGTSDLNAWVSVFGEFAELLQIPAEPSRLYELLYRHSLTGDADCGGLLSYGYYSGEGAAGISEGRPLYARMPGSSFTLANLFRSHLYTALGAVKLGLDLLLKEEKIPVNKLLGHGGFFKTKGVGQRYLAAATGIPVTVMDTASEGGPWGMAVLAAYMLDGKHYHDTLEDYLEEKIFAGLSGTTVTAEPEEIRGYETFAEHYRAGLEMERAAVRVMHW